MKAYGEVDGDAYLSALKEATGRDWIEVFPGDYYKTEGDGWTAFVEAADHHVWSEAEAEYTWGLTFEIHAKGIPPKVANFPHAEDSPEGFASAAATALEGVPSYLRLVEKVRAFELPDGNQGGDDG